VAIVKVNTRFPFQDSVRLIFEKILLYEPCSPVDFYSRWHKCHQQRNSDRKERSCNFGANKIIVIEE